MKRLLLFLTIGLTIGGAIVMAYGPTIRYLEERNRPDWRTAEVTQGSIHAVVNSTGTVKPVLSVSIGSFVSGPIDELFCEFNQEVKKDDLLAKIDDRLYASIVAHDRAALATRNADLARAQAELQKSKNVERRANALREEDETFIAQAELDEVKFSRLALEAQVQVAESSVLQAQANLDNSEANLGYTEIRSPIDGIVIDRKIQPGQTLAAQFQMPELFIIAPDLKEKVHVHASVDEADIGLIRQAQLSGKPVHFTVDAYPDELFEGRIEEIRLSSTTLQNVVTYPVIVGVSNKDLKLLPGMTASISFQVDERTDVVRVPNSALRFYPQTAQVREADRPLLEGQDEPDEEQTESDADTSAAERSELRRKRNRRHVWMVEGNFLRAVPVETGLSEGQWTELVGGEVLAGQQLVIGIRPKKPFGQ
jgi:HlyD family secretion protein